jgi:phosphatidylglycerophosphate synthase
MQAVLFKFPGQEWWRLGGMTLLERNLRLLEAVGVKTALVLHPPGDIVPPFIVPRVLQIDIHVESVEFSSADPLAMLPSLHIADPWPLFFLDANLLIDQRVLETLSRQPPPCFVAMGNGKDPSPFWRVGWLRPEDLPFGPGVLQFAGRVSLTAVPAYSAELRGEATPYCERIRNEADLTKGWQLLIDRVSQRPGDLVEKYIDPPIENWLVRQWCHTPITPHHVTLLSVAVALAGASFLYQGQLFLGVIFAWIATVLDGVGGKLARLNLMTAKRSELGYMYKFFYENAWYLAVAARLAQTHDLAAWGIGLTITACNMCDTLLGAVFSQLKGKTLDEMSRFDQYSRLIGGRRSIYLLILLLGVLFNAPFLALQAAMAWAGVTVLVHAGRAAYHLLRH